MTEATAGCGPCGGGEGIDDPAWLAGEAAGSLTDPTGRRHLALYLPPPLLAPQQGTLLRVRGHFDDPRAATCRASIDGLAAPRAEMVGLCRRRFVVESLEVLPAPAPNPLE